MFLCLAALAAPADAVVNGDQSSGNPGFVAAVYKDGAQDCTGALIGPREVLTAAHCAVQPLFPSRSNVRIGDASPTHVEDSGIPIAASRLSVVVGVRDLASAGAPIPVESIAVHPDYVAAAVLEFSRGTPKRVRCAGDSPRSKQCAIVGLSVPWRHDLAVLRLAQPVLGVVPVGIAPNGSVTPGQQGVTVYGFGAVGSRDDDDLLSRTTYNLRNGALGIPLGDGESLIAPFPGYGADPAPDQGWVRNGDSGGPWLVSAGSVPLLVGVTSSFNPRALYAGMGGVYGLDRTWVLGQIPGGIGAKRSILVYGRTTSPDEHTNLEVALAAAEAGYAVTLSESEVLPADLSRYGQVWHIGYEATGSDGTRLVDFVRAGGSVLLSGEWGGAGAFDNANVASILTSLTGLPIAVTGVDDCSYLALPVNQGALDGAGSSPNLLSTWDNACAGSLSGVPEANTLVHGTGGAAGAVFEAGSGRIAVLMDSNWTNTAYSSAGSRDAMAENLAAFLSK
jgi:hypothetical protein